MAQRPVVECEKRLVTTWLVGALLLATLVLTRTYLGHYGERTEEAWDWLLATILPTLSLTVSAVVVDLQDRRKQRKQVNSYLFWVALVLSLAYLLFVGAIVVSKAFAPVQSLDVMREYGVRLAVAQAVVVSSLGAFFVRS